MPKIINEMPAIVRGKREPKYPWAEWFDGTPREFTQGDGDDADFTSTIRTFIGMAYKAGRELGFKVTCSRTGENTLAMVAVPRPEGEEATKPRRRKAAPAE